MEFIDIAKNAKKASLEAAKLDTETKNKALKSIADNLEKHTDEIFEANKQDLENAQLLVQDGELSQSAYHRLKLDIPKMRDMIQGVRDVASLDDPIGKVMLKRELDKGLVLEKISCPIGVLGIIFEARPDVISQISSLAIKSKKLWK